MWWQAVFWQGDDSSVCFLCWSEQTSMWLYVKVHFVRKYQFSSKVIQ